MMFYSFHDCVLDLRCYTLHRAGVLMSLGPKAFNVLVYLLRHRDRVVLKEELCTLLWPGQAISDMALARCIASIRKAVGDTGGEQKIIQTLYGYGYRFIAAVAEGPLVPPASADLAVAPPSPHQSQAIGSPAARPDFPPPSWDVDEPQQRACAPIPMQEWALREVTVLCGALAHTTVLTARLAPATLHCLLHGFFEQAQRAVQHSSGCMQTLLDDSFVALFGVSVPGEDHAQRAVQAALQLQQSLSAQSASHGVLGGEAGIVRLGAHTGTVVGRRLGTDRRLTYMAVGDTIRCAIRLQQLAEPNTLLLSGATARRVQGDVSIAVCGPVHIVLGEQNDQQSHSAYTIHGQRL